MKKGGSKCCKDKNLAGDAAGVGERQGFEGEKEGGTVGEELGPCFQDDGDYGEDYSQSKIIGLHNHRP